jgi:hypothetical protein
MWMGMTSRSANLATLKTILFVQIIPWFGIAFASSMLMGLVMSGLAFRARSGQPITWMAWWPLVSALFAAILSLAKDVGFIMWSRKRLHSSIREEAARSFDQTRFSKAPPEPPIIAAPPIVATPQ